MHTRILVISDNPEKFKREFLKDLWCNQRSIVNENCPYSGRDKVLILDEYPKTLPFPSEETSDHHVRIYVVEANEDMMASKAVFTSTLVVTDIQETIKVTRHIELPTGMIILDRGSFKKIVEITHGFRVAQTIRQRVVDRRGVLKDLKDITPINLLD